MKNKITNWTRTWFVVVATFNSVTVALYPSWFRVLAIFYIVFTAGLVSTFVYNYQKEKEINNEKGN